MSEKKIRWSHFYFLLQSGKNPHTSKDPDVQEWFDLGVNRLFTGKNPLITMALRDKSTNNPRSKENLKSIEFVRGDSEISPNQHRLHSHCSILVKHTGIMWIDGKILMDLFQEVTKTSKWPEGRRLAFFSVNGRADTVREGEEYQSKETGKVKKQVISYE